MATMSIRLDGELIKRASLVAKATSRTAPKQIEHWAKIGRIMEENPDLPYEFIRQILISKAEKEAGLLEEYVFD